MSGRSHDRLPPKVTSGEIFVGLAWLALYGALIVSSWARDAALLVAARASGALF